MNTTNILSFKAHIAVQRVKDTVKPEGDTKSIPIREPDNSSGER